jgi:hypothetical protein
LNLRGWVRNSLCGRRLEKRLNGGCCRLLKSAASRSGFGFTETASQSREPFCPRNQLLRALAGAPLTFGLRIPRAFDGTIRDDGTRTHPSAFSRRENARALPTATPENRGSRECRALDAPAASHAKIIKHTSIVTTVTPGTPGIPRAMVLTVSFVISPVIGLCCHRRQQVTTCQLDASVEASGPHDFAVREPRAFVFRAALRPPHPVPRS